MSDRTFSDYTFRSHPTPIDFVNTMASAHSSPEEMESMAREIQHFPHQDVIRIQDYVNEMKSKTHFAALSLIKSMMIKDLSVATAESLTGGLIFSTLADVPIGGKTKYGCFSVYDTDAKRVFLGVEENDVYTHKCATEMAIGVLKNSNATLAIAVTGNAMPWQGLDSEREIFNLGEVFIGCAGYNKQGVMVVESQSYNFTEKNYKCHDICKIWINTVRNEIRLHNYLEKRRRQGDAEVPNDNEFDFRRLHDGFNDFVLTSQISEFIRACTCYSAIIQAMKFIKDTDLMGNRVASSHNFIHKIDSNVNKIQ
jgi:PncC family amidohydrolase